VIFAPKYVFRVVFEGGFFGGARNFWGNPYLNSTTILFDMNKMAYFGIFLFSDITSFLYPESLADLQRLKRTL